MAANPELKQQLEQAISDNQVLLLMKGTPDAPRCGFSMRAAGALGKLIVDEIAPLLMLPIGLALRQN
jgi:monothiol glutaredoxin